MNKKQIEKELRVFKRRTGSKIVVTKEIAKLIEDIDKDLYIVTKFV